MGQLAVARVPGEHGPILRCIGSLTARTARTLRLELDLLEPIGHTVVFVNLAECDYLNLDGLFALIEAARRLERQGTRLVLVEDGGLSTDLLRVLGVDELMPVFPSQNVADRALRGCASEPRLPADWEEARRRTVERWHLIDETLQKDPNQGLRLMTSVFALCELSQAFHRRSCDPTPVPCEFCPLFHLLGGQSQDVGCCSIINPLILLTGRGDIAAASSRIGEVIQMIEGMRLVTSDSTRSETTAAIPAISVGQNLDKVDAPPAP